MQSLTAPRADVTRRVLHPEAGIATAELSYLRSNLPNSMINALFATVATFSLIATASQAAQASRLVAVELFTSQACSSCPAANAYFEELAARKDIVALSWHVDYWNDMATTKGRWTDPYSTPLSTARQRAYNRRLRDSAAVYTPQIVVNGAATAIGSARDNVDAHIASARNNPIASNSLIKATPHEDTLRISITGDGVAQLVYFQKRSRTNIEAGENAGKRVSNTHSVTKATALGSTNGHGEFAVAAPRPGEHCAILLQAANQGPIIAAQYCPTR